MTDLASLGIKIDSGAAVSGAAQAENALNRVTDAATKTTQKLMEIKVDSKTVTQPVASIRDSLKDLFDQIDASKAKGVFLQAQQQNIREMNTGVMTAAARFTGLASAIGSVAGPFAALLGVNAIRGGIEGQIQFANAIGNTASQSGLAAQEFSELVFAAGKFGVGMNGVSDSLRRMQQELAGDGKEIARIGLNLADVRRQSPDKQFELIAQRISEIKGQAERTAAAVAIFGQAGANLLPLFMKGAAGIREAREEAVRLGVTVSGEMVAKMQAADAAIQRLSFLKREFWANVAVGAETFAEAIGAIKPPEVSDAKKQLDDLLAQRRDLFDDIRNQENSVVEKWLHPEELARSIAASKDRLKELEAQINSVNDTLLKLGKENTPAGSVDVSEFGKQAAEFLKQQQLLSGAKLGIDLAGIQRQLDTGSNAYANYLRELDALRSSHEVSEQQYYAAIRAVIQQVADLHDQALAKEIDSLRRADAEEKKRLNARAGMTPEERTAAENAYALHRLANEDAIAAKTQQRAKIAANAATEIDLANKAEVQGVTAVKNAYTEASTAAQVYLDVQQRQQDRALDALGKGSRQQQRDSGLNDIEDRYAQQRLDLEAQKRGKQIDDDEYDRQLKLINDFQQKAIASYNQYWDDLSTKQSDFMVGVHQALADYVDSSADVAGQTNKAFTNTFGTLEDALVTFATTGKLSFKDLAQSILADLLRIQIRALAVKAITGLFNGASATTGSNTFAGGTDLSGGGALPAAKGAAFDRGRPVSLFAGGGIVDQPTGFTYGGGKAGVMGEAGTEGIFPLRRNSKGQLGVMAAGGEGTQITINSVVNAAPGVDVAQMHALLDARDEQLEGKIADNLTRGRWKI